MSPIRSLVRSIAVVALLAGCRATPSTSQSVSQSTDAAAPRVLLVVTSQSTLGPRPDPTGLYLSEASHPWRVFSDRGFEILLASPSGGPAPIDPKSVDLADEANREFLEAVGVEDGSGWRIADTVRLDSIDPSEIDAVFFAGGHGTMWDFPNVPSVRRVAEDVHRDGGVVAAVCHGPAALVGLVDASGAPLVAGRRLTAFTDSEEAAVELTDAMPFLLESRLRDLGARFEGAEDFQAMVVVDERLVTGQNPASATGVAVAVADLLGPASP
ncbi:MAG: type 1 glutamine amidotransferase domain-containing protein [Planctomycetota bacterium]|jgi:putative intracellular protease/amidase